MNIIDKQNQTTNVQSRTPRLWESKVDFTSLEIENSFPEIVSGTRGQVALRVPNYPGQKEGFQLLYEFSQHISTRISMARYRERQNSSFEQLVRQYVRERQLAALPGGLVYFRKAVAEPLAERFFSPNTQQIKPAGESIPETTEDVAGKWKSLSQVATKLMRMQSLQDLLEILAGGKLVSGTPKQEKELRENLSQKLGELRGTLSNQVNSQIEGREFLRYLLRSGLPACINLGLDLVSSHLVGSLINDLVDLRDNRRLDENLRGRAQDLLPIEGRRYLEDHQLALAITAASVAANPSDEIAAS